MVNPTMTKAKANYHRIVRRTFARRKLRKCGNCSMFVRRPVASVCTLVIGVIEPEEHVCDHHRWN